MPIYGFRCNACEATYERYFSVRDSKPQIQCEKCEGTCERDFMAEARNHRPSSAFPFVTSHISGKPIEVKSEAHLQSLCKQYGVRHRPDAAWLEDEWQGNKVKEGRGHGMPGSWV